MKNAIYIWKKPVRENPINDIHYQQLLWLNPALTGEIQRHVRDVLFEDIRVLTKDELYDNTGIIPRESIKEAKTELIAELQKLEGLTGESQHIFVVADDCFTNGKLLSLLRDILGQENYEKFVKLVPIDYEKPADMPFLEENLSTNHSLFIIGGSMSDVDSMEKSHYDSPLSRMMRDVADDNCPREVNKRLIPICFGQQYLANIIGRANKSSTGIIATLRWPSQFAPSNCRIQELEYERPIYKQILAWLSNHSKNTEFSCVFTRSGYVSFDLLKTEWEPGIVPLIRDLATDGIVGWGTKNGYAFGFQWHPEADFGTTIRDIEKIAPILSPDPEEQRRFIRNFDTGDRIKRDIGEAFYVFAILAYIRDIRENCRRIREVPKSVTAVPYPEAIRRLIDTVSQRVNFAVEDHSHLADHEMTVEWIDAIDREKRLRLLTRLDWKVGRGIEEVSTILGIHSLADVIRDLQEINGDPYLSAMLQDPEKRERLVSEYRNSPCPRENFMEMLRRKRRDECPTPSSEPMSDVFGLEPRKNFVVRDFGAGDGTTLRQLYQSLKYRDIVCYGTGDFIYFDLFAAIKDTRYMRTFPEELVILFVEKTIGEFKKTTGSSVIERIQEAIAKARFSRDDTIRNSSMTNVKTFMFEDENLSPLSRETQERFDEYLMGLNELKNFLIDNIYRLFPGFFQRIYISKFSDLKIEDPLFSQVDFQYSVRATSHVNGREYMRIISDYYHDSAKPGSVFFDNGVHGSYVSTARLDELLEVSRNVGQSGFKLIYDTENNSFCMVIIPKDIEYPDELWESHLREGFIVVPLEEAQRSTFFQLDYFIRNFITANFKNSIVFWNFNSQIDHTLKAIMRELEKNDVEKILEIVLGLINHIAESFQDGNVRYNTIELKVLERYALNGKSLRDILAQEIYIPQWMNIHANGNY